MSPWEGEGACDAGFEVVDFKLANILEIFLFSWLIFVYFDITFSKSNKFRSYIHVIEVLTIFHLFSCYFPFIDRFIQLWFILQIVDFLRNFKLFTFLLFCIWIRISNKRIPRRPFCNIFNCNFKWSMGARSMTLECFLTQKLNMPWASTHLFGLKKLFLRYFLFKKTNLQ